MKNNNFLYILLCTLALLISCDKTLIGGDDSLQYTIVYSGNKHTSGTPPKDTVYYAISDSIMVLPNIGGLEKTDFHFSGWNTQANGLGVTYKPYQSFIFNSSHDTLFAYWKSKTYTVTYNGNGNTSGIVPQDNKLYTTGDRVPVLPNYGNLKRFGYTFTGWNTKPDGSGTTLQKNNLYTIIRSNVTLFAQWKQTAMILTVLLSDSSFQFSNSIVLPFHDIDKLDVDWGDGTQTTYITKPYHQYKKPGKYTIKITGSAERFGETKLVEDEIVGYNSAVNIITVESFGDLNLKSLYGAFADAKNLTSVPSEIPQSVTDVSFMFYKATLFNGDIRSWQTKNITNMSHMFRNAHSFNQPIDTWNTEKVTNMSSMFQSAISFNQNLNSWDISKVVFYNNFDNGTNSWDYNNKPKFKIQITYSSFDHTSGEPPIEKNKYYLGDTITILPNTGNLAKMGYTFSGWYDQYSDTTYTPNDKVVLTSSRPFNLMIEWK